MIRDRINFHNQHAVVRLFSDPILNMDIGVNISMQSFLQYLPRKVSNARNRNGRIKTAAHFFNKNNFIRTRWSCFSEFKNKLSTTWCWAQLKFKNIDYTLVSISTSIRHKSSFTIDATCPGLFPGITNADYYQCDNHIMTSQSCFSRPQARGIHCS